MGRHGGGRLKLVYDEVEHSSCGAVNVEIAVDLVTKRLSDGTTKEFSPVRRIVVVVDRAWRRLDGRVPSNNILKLDGAPVSEETILIGVVLQNREIGSDGSQCIWSGRCWNEDICD
jgi:hypothetical protein